MGYYKELQMQQDEQGWDSSDKCVCVNCVDDYALEAAIVSAEEQDEECSFCGRSPVAPLDALLEVFVNGLRNEYRDADHEGVPWDGREGGYQTTTIDSWDLVLEFYDVLTGDGLFEAVQAQVHDRAWVERNWMHRRRDQVLKDSWEQFCHARGDLDAHSGLLAESVALGGRGRREAMRSAALVSAPATHAA